MTNKHIVIFVLYILLFSPNLTHFDSQHLLDTFFVYKHWNARENDRTCPNTNGNAGVHEITRPTQTPDSTILKFCDKAPLFTISFWMLKKIKNKSFPCVAKNATGQRRYCHAVVSSCAIKHFFFQKLARLISHLRIYGSKVAVGISAFQHWSCVKI